jgi:hypothetical protein
LLVQVVGASAYTVNTYTINPGISSVFPWLSPQALLWDMYKFTALYFTYEPACATSTNGALFMGFDFDVYDSSPIDKSTFMMLADAVSGPSWSRVSLPLARPRLSQRGNLYVSPSANPTGVGDLKTYHLGNLFVGVQGQGDTNYMGDIYVTYVIELTMPQQAQTTYMSAISADATTGQTRTVPFGTSGWLESSPVPIGAISYNSTNNIFTFDISGCYMLNWIIGGSVITSASGDVTLGKDTGIYANDALVVYDHSNWASSEGASYYIFCFVQEGNYAVFDVGTATTITSTLLWVLPCNYVAAEQFNL